ncbi:hypothetical protein [Ahrensia sp. R2A130]|uniref:hypothetical protein n=1 Tax=Ahrensia sp. R2A130 TaxID=744979 RepID=UPI0001E0BCBB|nr:hypothetical protein [Ahrensia sp. R2A130]EFL88323.1 conserved hypothetical protein [Ahrensia sp. R2A130]
MSNISNIRDLIDQWDTIVEFQHDMGLPYVTARAMRVRNSAAPNHWPKLVEVAEAKGIEGVTFEWLTGLRKAKSKAAA